jgi:hypothetical protein
MIVQVYDRRQDDDIVYAVRKHGSKVVSNGKDEFEIIKTRDVGSSHPGGGEAPKGLAVRQ